MAIVILPNTCPNVTCREWKPLLLSMKHGGFDSISTSLGSHLPAPRGEAQWKPQNGPWRAALEQTPPVQSWLWDTPAGLQPDTGAEARVPCPLLPLATQNLECVGISILWKEVSWVSPPSEALQPHPPARVSCDSERFDHYRPVLSWLGGKSREDYKEPDWGRLMTVSPITKINKR